MSVVVDAYAWLELFLGGPRGVKVREIVESAESVYTPGTVLAEISRKYLREDVAEKIVRERLSAIQAASRIVHITPELAVSASRAYLELSDRARKKRLSSPSLFDGIVLGTTRLKSAKVVTGDPHFKDLPETIWV